MDHILIQTVTSKLNPKLSLRMWEHLARKLPSFRDTVLQTRVARATHGTHTQFSLEDVLNF